MKISAIHLILKPYSDLIGNPLTEYRFAPPRRCRFYYAWPGYMVAIEIEGGVWTRGRHTRAAGYRKDCEKYNRAQLIGWTVLRYTYGDDASKEAELLASTLK